MQRQPRRRGLVVFVSFALLLCLSLSVHAAIPAIQGLKYNPGKSTVRIAGTGFGNPCPTCEVIADYGEFSYSAVVKKWTDKLIQIELPDFGKAIKVSLKVSTKDGTSKPKIAKLTLKITPSTQQRSLAKQNSVPGLVMHEYKSQQTVGDKGENTYDVSEAAPACEQKGFRFHDVDLIIGKRTRFGEAKIVAKPKRGCATCSPVKVRYFHEPTGMLHFQLIVYRREITGVCPQRIRH